jgi:hypothetical protein
MMVGILTEEQKDKIKGTKYNEHYYFNPIKDEDNNWVISEYEIEQSNLDWIKNIPKIEFKPSKFKIQM